MGDGMLHGMFVYGDTTRAVLLFMGATFYDMF